MDVLGPKYFLFRDPRALGDRALHNSQNHLNAMRSDWPSARNLPRPSNVRSAVGYPDGQAHCHEYLELLGLFGPLSLASVAIKELTRRVQVPNNWVPLKADI